MTDKELYDKCHVLFRYEGGNLIRRVTVAPNARVGDMAGCSRPDGYITVSIDHNCHRLSRIIFLMHEGYLPEIAEHADNDQTNNKIENLRAATKAENERNTGSRKGTSSKYKCVSWSNNRSKWVARMYIEGSYKSLGYYTNEDDAARAINLGILMYHGKFARFNTITTKE